MRTKSLFALCALLAVTACATAPNTPNISAAPKVPVNFIGCSSNLLPPVLANGDPRAVLILFGLEVGYDVAVYGTCTVERLAHPSAVGTATEGVFRSGQSTFSMALPAPPADAREPSIDIIQPSVLPSESVLLRPMSDGEVMKSGAVIFGVTMSRQAPLEQSGTVEQAGLEELDHGNTAIKTGPDVPTLMHHEPATLDGRPALFAIYSLKLSMDGSHATPAYLFAYFTRYQDNSAVLAILWSGDCRECAEGHEADIRKLDTNIGRLVESFQLDEAALQAWDTANPKPAGKPAPQPLSHIDIPSGKALVYFYREPRFLGGPNFHIQDGDKELGTLATGTYFHVIVDAGAHAFNLSTWGSDENQCQIQVNSGETHYLDISSAPNPSFFHSAPVMSCRELPELETRNKMADLKESTDE